MLVSAKEMLEKAKAGHYAVGQFNINNLEWTKSVLLTAEELQSPVILGVSEGAGKYMTGFGTVAAMVKAMHDELGITVPVALHLDHGTYEGCYKCIKAGFTSIMFDGSHYPIDENVEKTKELVQVAHAMGMSIEAEVGSIGGEEDGVVGMGECADPDECKRVADLGVDMLAAGIGGSFGNADGSLILFVILTIISFIFSIRAFSSFDRMPGHKGVAGLIFGMVSMLIGDAVLLFQPVLDAWYYGAAFIIIASVLITLINVIRAFNVLTTRKLPQFATHKGGDDRA